MGFTIVEENLKCRVNGQDVDTEYARFENDYVPQPVERKAEIITFSFGGKTLVLNFQAGTREEA